jgi:hypothetical protein
MTTQTTTKPPLSVEHIKAVCHDILLPPRTDPDTLQWGWRICKRDLTSREDYRWPFPGHWAKASGPFRTDHLGGCPKTVGDGICVATSLSGAASAGQPLTGVGLLVAWHEADVLGQETGKLRVKRAWVADMFDAVAALSTASKSGADLAGANLAGADLARANLSGANLFGANLSGANLFRANLAGADLHGARLHGADLHGARLSGANLYGADLAGADLSGADLYGADLAGADLHGARYDQVTLFSAGFDPIAAGAVKV